MNICSKLFLSFLYVPHTHLWPVEEVGITLKSRCVSLHHRIIKQAGRNPRRPSSTKSFLKQDHLWGQMKLLRALSSQVSKTSKVSASALWPIWWPSIKLAPVYRCLLHMGRPKIDHLYGFLLNCYWICSNLCFSFMILFIYQEDKIWTQYPNVVF